RLRGDLAHFWGVILVTWPGAGANIAERPPDQVARVPDLPGKPEAASRAAAVRAPTFPSVTSRRQPRSSRPRLPHGTRTSLRPGTFSAEVKLRGTRRISPPRGWCSRAASRWAEDRHPAGGGCAIGGNFMEKDFPLPL